MPLPVASVPCVSLSVFVSLSGRPRLVRGGSLHPFWRALRSLQLHKLHLKVAWFSYCSSTLIAFDFLAEVGCHLNACLTSFVFPRPFDPRWIRVHLTSLQLSLFLFYILRPVVCSDSSRIRWLWRDSLDCNCQDRRGMRAVMVGLTVTVKLLIISTTVGQRPWFDRVVLMRLHVSM